MEIDGSPGSTPVDEKTSLATTTASFAAKDRRLERSCLMCHQRKIRCDKRSPCANCVRADLFCCYPGPERRRRRPQKTTIADVAARVAQLERTIKAISSGVGSSDLINASNPDPMPPASNADESHTRKYPLTEELLVQDGNSNYYINEVLLSRILEEEQELQSIVGTPGGDSDRMEKSSSFDIGAIFSDFNQRTADIKSYLPSLWQATQLWQAFLSNVNPLVKILHIPTTQAVFFAAINNPNDVEDDLNALLFSIYFSATTSLAATDATDLLGQDRSTTLRKYKKGLEQSLTTANLLETPTIRALQAITIYLTSLRALNGGRSVWTLNGLALRSAQSIGLHRDGKNFNVSPFEAEMRRRLWWFIFTYDARAAEDHGITIQSLDTSSDTRLPSNLDDCELSPNMDELPATKSKWSEMTFTLAMTEINNVFLHFYQASTHNQSDSERLPKIKELDDLNTRLENVYLLYCDPNIPIQKATILTVRVILAKMGFVMRQQWLKHAKPRERASHATEETLVRACEILEMGLLLHEDDLLRGFLWLLQSYTQYHMMTYVLWHLCVKPVGPSVERAWNAIDKCFEIGNRRNTFSDLGSRWTFLQRLREKSMRIRSCPTDQYMVDTAQSNPYEAIAITGNSANATDFTFPAEANWDNWDISPTSFPEWNTFADKFEMQEFLV